MAGGHRDKKEDEDGGGGGGWDKAAVLQEARHFNAPVTDARRCAPILTKLLHLLNRGEVLSAREATDAFFQVTKLFQSQEPALRRLVYLAIKELAGVAEDVIVVTSSLSRDMTGPEEGYRAAAIRALAAIARHTDAATLAGVERYMRQAIVDRNPGVASAALASALRLADEGAADVVRRWANEAQEALNSDDVHVQYHALGLLYRVRRQDRLAVAKLVERLARAPPRSPLAVCLLIRAACRLADEGDHHHLDFVEACLRHKSETVVYEAARALVHHPAARARELAPAVGVLQLFCGSAKPALRFAAVRTLNAVAHRHPQLVTGCNVDLENLISDSNRSVATLAITTLLKTGAESSVDRLMKQIATFVSEISDEFKIVVVRAIRALCLKFPRKHQALVAFLSAMLRDEGGLEYKAAIADAVIAVIEHDSDAKETGLAHLCEFIEDCEHTSLAVRILHLLGREGPQARQPSRYVRFVYNRVILENANVRAAAVAAMAQFGARCPDLLPNVRVLLDRCRTDSDDEVRDRAAYFGEALAEDPPDAELLDAFVARPPPHAPAALERALRDHLARAPRDAFDLAAVPAEERERAEAPVTRPRAEPSPLDALREHAQLLGPLHKSSAAVELTESETEYTVKCVKHVFARHVVLQFDCVNTMNDQLLERVRVRVDPPPGFAAVASVACARLPYGERGTALALLRFPDDPAACVGSFALALEFVVRECGPDGDPADDGYEDEYSLEDLELSVADLVRPGERAEPAADWARAEDTYALTSVSTLREAVDNVLDFLGVTPLDGSQIVPDAATSHTLRAAGTFKGDVPLLVLARLVAADGLTMQLTAHSPDGDVADLVTAAIG